MQIMFQSEAWGSPVGLAVFLIGAGVFLYLLAVANRNNRLDK